VACSTAALQTVEGGFFDGQKNDPALLVLAVRTGKK
jgi:hypothetical protein